MVKLELQIWPLFSFSIFFFHSRFRWKKNVMHEARQTDLITRPNIWFANLKICFLNLRFFYPLKIALQKSFYTQYFPHNIRTTSDRVKLGPYLESAALN